MNRSFRIALAALGFVSAGCASQLRPAEGRGDVAIGASYGSGYPIAVGAELTVHTSWSGWCQGPARPSTGYTASTAGRIFECAEQEYSLEIDCEDASTIVRRPVPCEIADDEAHRQTRDRYTRADVRGDHSFRVRALGVESLSIVATLHHGHETLVERTPRLHVFVPGDVVVECRPESSAPPIPCDAVPPNVHPWLVVHGMDGTEVSDIVVNRQRHVRNNEPLPSHEWLPADAFDRGTIKPGDYHLSIDVSPTPFTIHKDIKVHVG